MSWIIEFYPCYLRRLCLLRYKSRRSYIFISVKLFSRFVHSREEIACPFAKHCPVSFTRHKRQLNVPESQPVHIYVLYYYCYHWYCVITCKCSRSSRRSHRNRVNSRQCGNESARVAITSFARIFNSWLFFFNADKSIVSLKGNRCLDLRRLEWKILIFFLLIHGTLSLHYFIGCPDTITNEDAQLLHTGWGGWWVGKIETTRLWLNFCLEMTRFDNSHVERDQKNYRSDIRGQS